MGSIALLVSVAAIRDRLLSPGSAAQPAQDPLQTAQTFRPSAVAALYDAQKSDGVRQRSEAEEE